jgi:hypothetical protein
MPPLYRVFPIPARGIKKPVGRELPAGKERRND